MLMKRLLSVLILLGIGFFIFRSQSEAQSISEFVKPPNLIEREVKSVPGQLVIKFKEETAESEPGSDRGEPTSQINTLEGVSALLDEYGVSSVKPVGTVGNLSRMVVVQVSDDVDLDVARQAFEENSNIEYAEPNYLYYPHFVPNDPYYDNGGNVLDYFQWNLGRVNMPQAWDLVPSRGSESVVVAVLDTGVAFENYTEDGVTYKKAPELDGINFVSPRRHQTIGFETSLCFPVELDPPIIDTHPFDDQGHGTHVTSTIAQAINNNTHGAGIADNVSIMPVKVLHDPDCGGSFVDIAAGVEHAYLNGADVINMSLGGPSGNAGLQDALQDAVNAGTVVIASSGNSASRGSSPAVGYPAAYPETIAVGATRWDNMRSDYSQYGVGLDIVAPGGQVFNDSFTEFLDQNRDELPDGILAQTIKEGNPSAFSDVTPVDEFFDLRCISVVGTSAFVNLDCGLYMGTSMATPHVSAAAALLLTLDPTLSPAEIRSILKSSANSSIIPGYNSNEHGAGLLDVRAALLLVDTPTLDSDRDNDGDVDRIDYDDIIDDARFSTDAFDVNTTAREFGFGN